MAVALELRVGDLLAELLAHADVLLCEGQLAGAVQLAGQQALANLRHKFIVCIEVDSFKRLLL